MKVRTIDLHIDAPGKPAIGQPCNGCGVCCALETCPIAMLRFLRRRGPCPALIWRPERSRYVCDLLEQPGQYLPLLPASHDWARRILARGIAAGQGCDCTAVLED